MLQLFVRVISPSPEGATLPLGHLMIHPCVQSADAAVVCKSYLPLTRGRYSTPRSPHDPPCVQSADAAVVCKSYLPLTRGRYSTPRSPHDPPLCIECRCRYCW